MSISAQGSYLQVQVKKKEDDEGVLLLTSFSLLPHTSLFASSCEEKTGWQGRVALDSVFIESP